MSDAWIRRATLSLLVAVGVFCIIRLDLTNSIRHFIPLEHRSELIELSLALVDSPLARHMVLTVGGGEKRAGVAAALAERLLDHEEISWIETGLDDDALRGIYELYFRHRIYFASDRPTTQIPDLLTPEALDQRAADLRRNLARPGAALAARTAPSDPLGLFDRILSRIRSSRPALSSEGSVLMSADGRYAIILAGLRSSPFDSRRQAELLAYLGDEFARLDRASGGGHELEISGVNRIAIASEQGIRADANLISAVSVTVVCTLFLCVFRSLRQLAIAILTPVAGFAVALAVALFGGEPVHGITVGFGFVLIGVAIDYPIHLMNHHALSPPGTQPRDTLAKLRSSLLLSGLTTTLAFMALAFSDFPGLRDMGTFAAVGVPVSLGVTMLSVPAFMRPSVAGSPTQMMLAAGFVGIVRWLRARPGFTLASFVICAFVSVVGISRLEWEDDPATLIAADPSLLEEGERVRGRLVDLDGGRFVIGVGADPERALALNDRIYLRLEEAVRSGHLDGLQSIHSVLWSEEVQRQNLEALKAVPDLGDRIEDAFVSHGFRPGSFRAFDDVLAHPDVKPLRPEDFVGSPLEHVLDSIAALGDRWAIVTYLRGAESGDAIRSALEGLEGAHYIDQKEIVGRVYGDYRRSTVDVIVLGCIVIFVILQIRYRHFGRGLLAFASAALAALTTFGVFGLLSVSVNVVSAVSLLVVLGIAVDYGIFSVDGGMNQRRLGATLSSILVSCLTSVSVFGALALSNQPALRAIGLTTGTGILIAFVLSPSILALVPRDER